MGSNPSKPVDGSSIGFVTGDYATKFCPAPHPAASFGPSAGLISVLDDVAVCPALHPETPFGPSAALTSVLNDYVTFSDPAPHPAALLEPSACLTSVLNDSVTFFPASHPATPFGPSAGLTSVPNEDPALTVFRHVWGTRREPTELLQTSVTQNLDDIIPQRNGFVHTVIEAYNKHRALIIRPDDVWLAILIQFNFFVNGNAELLRKNFVSHAGKEKLTVKTIGNRYSVDFSSMSQQMTLLMESKIVDPHLREWIMPTFSTTSTTDTTIYAMVMMTSMKHYFSYKLNLLCGIPKVTLEGTKEDWQKIVSRLEKLKEYGEDATSWYHLLRPVISRFVDAYDDPDSPELRDFWNKVAHRGVFGCGSEYLSGWITAFCFFSEKGSRIAQVHESPWNRDTSDQLVLDGVSYPKIDSKDIPLGFAGVDVELDDNGEKFDTILVAGSVGSQICMGTDSVRDAIRPLPAWWYVIMKEVKH